LLFLVKQEVDTYDTYQKRIAECDEQLQQQLASFASVAPEVAAAALTQVQGDDQPKQAKAKRKKPAKNAPGFNLEQELQRVAGVNLTRIDGIDVMVAQTILAEVGLDMGRWKTESHFASWLGLCPDNRVTGDKVVGRGTRHVVNRAATALRMAANALLRSHTYLGAQYRRLRTKLGAPKAITAMAHRLARLVYRMLKYGQRYVDKGAEHYEQRYRNQQLQFLRKKVAQLGFQLTEAEAQTA
jgi:transposase